MCKELPVLHYHVSVGGRVVEVTVNDCREDPRVRQWVTRDGDSRCRLTISIGRWQQSLEASEGLSPVWITQIVATSVGVSIARRTAVSVLLTLAVIDSSTSQR